MTDRALRVLWTAIGAALVAVGVVGVLASAGWLGGTDSDSPLLWSWALETWRDAGRWAPALVALLGLPVLALGAWLVRAQLHFGGPALHSANLATGNRGATALRTQALGGALSADLRRIAGVDGASVTLRGSLDEADVEAQLDVAPGVRLDLLADRVTTALDRFTTTTGGIVRSCEVTVRISDRTPTRVA